LLIVRETCCTSNKIADSFRTVFCVLIAVGQFSCRLSSPCTYSNIMTFGYYFPHYDPTKYIQCGYWDPVAMYATCREYFCPSGTVWDQSNGYCSYPVNTGSSKCILCCYFVCGILHKIKFGNDLFSLQTALKFLSFVILSVAH